MTVRKGLAAMAAKTWWYSRSHGCENVVILSQPWLRESGDTLVSAKTVELRSDGCDKMRTILRILRRIKRSWFQRDRRTGCCGAPFTVGSDDERCLVLSFSVTTPCARPTRVNTKRLAERETLLHRLGSKLNRTVSNSCGNPNYQRKNT